MKRRDFFKGLVLGGLGISVAPVVGRAGGVVGASRGLEGETSAVAIAEGLAQGRLSSVGVCRRYLDRIRRLDADGPKLRSVIEVNPEVLRIARGLDRERARRGVLHGVPVLIKDNIATRDRMQTTAGSLAMVGSRPGAEAVLVKRLREAGAVLLGKTNLSEWANFRGNRSLSGWSSRGGQTRNPHVLDRNPSGSSSGSAVAVAADLAPLAVGTETDGSIISPASKCGVVGIKPTVGLISRSGIIPISHSQDTAGPMARSVADAALLLGVLASVDPEDEATLAPGRSALADYMGALDAGALRGARLGVARSLFTGSHPGVRAVADRVLQVLRDAGAELVELPDFKGTQDLWAAESVVLHYEFKAGLNRYLASLEPGFGIRSLADLIRYNDTNQGRLMPWFGQERLVEAEAKGPLTDAVYLEALAKCRRLSREEGLDRVLGGSDLAAVVALGDGPAEVVDPIYGGRGSIYSSWAAAVSGYPSICVPGGDVQGLPIGVCFIGRAWSEARLIGLAHAFEQACPARLRPGFRPTLEAPNAG